MLRSIVSLAAVCLRYVPGLAAPAPATAVCDFDADTQLAVEYQPISVNSNKPIFGHEIPYNKVWAPGGKPMTMFLNHPVTVGDRQLPVGAYTIFVLPAENKWTLIISSSTDTSGKYDEHHDVVRVPMQSGELSSAEDRFSVYFAHVAPGQCTMRVDLGKNRAWADFFERK